MKKIALVLYYYTPYMSGLSEYARSIAEEIAKDKDTQVDVLVSLHDPKISKEEVVNNVNIKRFKPLFSLSKWIFIPSMFSYIFKNRKNYDKFFVFMPFAESGLFPLIVDKNKLYAFYVCDIRVGKGLVSKIVESVFFSSMRV